MAENETYKISVVCRNCGHIPGGTVSDYGANAHIVPQKFSIPKGIEVKTWLQGGICDNCGCEGYMGLLNQPD